MLENSSKMSTREAIAILAGPYHGNRDRWLANAAKAVTGVSFRTMRSLWHDEIKNPDHLAAKAVRMQAQIVEARRDAAKLAEIYQGVAHAMGNTDPDFYRHQIDALVAAARILGGLDRT
jgi:glutamate-1-semialdehyde aminotransferase